MSTTAEQRESLAEELKTKKICRFCLTQTAPLSSVYERDARLKVLANVPLTLQVIACASIEVMPDDGMPQTVCAECRVLFEFCYRFKQMCKRSDTMLRQVPLTGSWPPPLTKPRYPSDFMRILQEEPRKNNKAAPQPQQPATGGTAPRPLAPKVAGAKGPGATMPVRKLLNANPAASPEPPAPKRVKREKIDIETEFLNKVENDEELSIDDVQRLIAAVEDDLAIDEEASPKKATPKSRPAAGKPVLLNKMKTRILNREAVLREEPRFSVPQVCRDEEGNMAIVTEILVPEEAVAAAEVDPIKDAQPVETNVFPCPHCERSFPLVQLRDIHVVNHSRERSFHCGDCDKAFFSKYDLQKHTMTHTGDRPFKCTACDKSFTRATLLHRHEKVHTDVPKFICVFCEKPFISREEMEKHTEKHRKKRPFQCRKCYKSFAFKQGLDRHEVVHMSDQPYPCQYCENSFSTPSKLARHLTAHAGSRPYPCKFCSKSYLLSHHLTRHMRSHKAGKVSFDCFECGVRFESRDLLIAHSSEHVHETLSCPLCKEVFEGVDQINEHIKKHAEGEDYACEFCDLIFIAAERLSRHIEDEHTVDMKAYLDDDKANAKAQSAGDIEPDEHDLEELEELVDEEFAGESDELDVKPSPKKVIPKTTSVAQKRKAPAASSDSSSEGEQSSSPPPPARKGLRSAEKSNANRQSAGGGPVKQEALSESPQKPQIKVEKPVVLNAAAAAKKKPPVLAKQPLIDKVLNSLPKGLSVRKNTAETPSGSGGDAAAAKAPSGPTREARIPVKGGTAVVAKKN